MNKLIEKIVERLSNYGFWKEVMIYDFTHRERTILCKAIDIIQEEAEAYKPKTNADYIRNMTDEELAKAISRNNTCVRCNIREYCHENIKCRNCVDAVLDWLKEEKEG